MKDKDINSLDHTTWRCQYHVVFAPKYRRLAIYDEIKVDIGKILRQLCQQKGIEIIEAELCPDHVRFSTSYACHQYHTLNMPWSNSVNKKAYINAVHTTLDVENMPLTSWVGAIE